MIIKNSRIHMLAMMAHAFSASSSDTMYLNSYDAEIPAAEPWARFGSGRHGKSGSEDCKKQLKARAKAKRGKKARRKMYAARK